MERFRIVESKRSKMHPGGLADWVQNEKWVDIRRKNKKGKFEPCGRNDTSKGEKPVCVPANKAKNLTEKQLKNRKRQKARKEKEPNPGKKPNTTKIVATPSKEAEFSNLSGTKFQVITKSLKNCKKSTSTLTPMKPGKKLPVFVKMQICHIRKIKK